MISRDELAFYLADLLAINNFQDYAPNGIQIEGKSSISCLCTAVTASADVISKAVELKADALLVHHGYFWQGEDPVIKGMKRERITRLLMNNLTLFAYHLPLDCHRELGNNAGISRLFELDEIKMHTIKKTPNLVWSGVLSTSKTAEELSIQLQSALNRKPLYIKGSDKPIRRVAWCSGAGQDFILEASHWGMDAYISGEVSERTYYQAQELGIHYFAAGHHATERFGVQSLGEHLAIQFGLQHQFIDSPNPI